MLTSRRAVLAVLVLGLALAGLALAGCERECEPSESHCEGNTAALCYRLSTKFSHGYDWSRTECGGGNVCIEGPDFAGCAVEATPCDPDTFEPTCKDGLPVRCTQPSIHSTLTYPVAQEPCKYGNTCFKGQCVADTTPCDESSFKPTCWNGKPVACRRDRPILDQHRNSYPSYMSDACAETGNLCVEGATYAGCSSDGSTCDADTFEPTCDEIGVKVCHAAAAHRETVYLTRYSKLCKVQTCHVEQDHWNCR